MIWGVVDVGGLVFGICKLCMGKLVLIGGLRCGDYCKWLVIYKDWWLVDLSDLGMWFV